jgi:hypothetical protein
MVVLLQSSAKKREKTSSACVVDMMNEFDSDQSRRIYFAMYCPYIHKRGGTTLRGEVLFDEYS